MIHTTVRASVASSPAPSSRSGAIQRNRRWVIGSTLAVASLLVSTALWATASRSPGFECRRAARVTYKVEAPKCELTGGQTDSNCIRQARAAYRADKQACNMN